MVGVRKRGEAIRGFILSNVTEHPTNIFEILSGDVYYAHDYGDPSEWIAQAKKSNTGTAV